MKIKTRFAPSPTGYLHVGNIRTALINWLYTKTRGGTFLLRIDDTDTQRSKPEYEEAIKEDMQWLGIEWDDVKKQSDRFDRYEEVKKKLIEDGRLYPCFETPEEIEIKRKMRLSRGMPPIYDREALKLTDGQVKKFEADGRKPHYRFKLLNESIEWQDEVRGKVRFEGKNLSDPILIRADGSMTYMLCSVVDDIDYEITNVVRGEDHVSNTAIGVQLCEALGGKNPEFAHLSLLKSKDSEISKRSGGFDIRSLREEYIESMSIVSLLSKIGSSLPIEIRNNMSEVIDEFDINNYGRNSAIYDVEELVRVNHKYLAKCELSDVEGNIKRLGIEIDQPFWDSVKGNISKVSELDEWYGICKSKIIPIIDDQDKDFLKGAKDCLPSGTWDENTWGEWTKSLKEKTGRKGKELFMPLRKALTARESGPELKQILPLIGSEKTAKRLVGEDA